MTISRRSALLFRVGMLFTVVSYTFVHAEGTKTLVWGDGKANRVNMVFLAEGYTQVQQTRFVNDVRRDMDTFFLYQPWSNFRNLCNVYAIGIVSADSGCDDPRDSVVRNTYFESSFDDYQQILLRNGSKVLPLLQEHVPHFHCVCVLVNDPRGAGIAGQYLGGGATIGYSIVTMNNQAPLVILHETGHTFAELGDEYLRGSSFICTHDLKNVTAQTQRSQIRWNTWIAASTPVPTPTDTAYFNVPGLFEGAGCVVGWYRPRYTCTMRSTASGVGYCEVCREEIVVSI